MRDVDISRDLLPQHHAVMRCLALLSRSVNTDHWCLVGGMMVLVVARAAGRTDSRAEGTKDGDIVVDVVAEPTILATFTHTLQSLGYSLPADDRGKDWARCTFASGHGQVDVLVPDDTPPEDLDVGDVRSIAIPGGRRALAGSELTSIYYSDDALDVPIRVPTLATAICVKAAAALDPRTEGHARHLEDAAFLLACISDPTETASELSSDDVDVLRRCRDLLAHGRHTIWRKLDRSDPSRVMAALDFLVD